MFWKILILMFLIGVLKIMENNVDGIVYTLSKVDNWFYKIFKRKK